MWWNKRAPRPSSRLPARSALAVALEPRMMFDGAVAATTADLADTQPVADGADVQTSTTDTQVTSDTLAATPVGTADSRQEVVFVDSQVKDYQQLVDGLKPGTEVVVLDASQDGLQQMADYLDGRSGIDAIHILSHGDVGKVQLGNDWLEGGDLASRSGLLNAIGQSLDSQGDILLYGCQVGANGEGQAFIDGLAAATGADVAASSDLTGAISKGGDWELESRSGLVETSAVGMAGYQHLLLAPGDENYDDDPGQSFSNTAVFTLDGIKYTITGTAGNSYSSVISNDAFSPLGNGGADYYMLFDQAGLAGISSIRIEAADGSAFRLLGLSIDGLADGNISITPNGGSALNFLSNGSFFTQENINLSANSQFTNITSFTISGGNLLLNLDDLNFDAPQVIPSLTSAVVSDTNLKAGETSLVTFTFNTAVSGFTTADLTVEKGSVFGLSSSDGGLTWTGTLTPTADTTDPTNLITVNLAGVTSVSTSTAGSGTASSNNYAIDTHLPVVSAVSSSTANGTYKAGDTIAITVSFDEAVTVTGTPQLTLETGSIDRVVNYASGSGTDTLTFNYTVQAGDTSADLDYLGSGALSLNGGSIRDSAGNDATLTLAVPGAAGSLGANKNIVVNSAPSIGNVSGDSVAWAGVGNTANLDSGGNATLADTEFGALNGGNGNWSGATLTVQRSGTAVTADTFGFNTAGALFSVSGTSASGNLQSGGVTFATYTHASGVLTISFTSSGTTATTALVNDVARHVTYRSDTPAGDATLRFTLSDGTSSATADATVTSDSIYVTNTGDTSTVNVSDGVSFSEAVAIAAADVTGSQTLILTNAFNSTVSLAGSLAINESLTIDASAASGTLISGGVTITLGGGTTLTFTNSSGSVNIASTLGGSGSLEKTGNGTLVLSSVSNEANMSGGITVSGGTLQVASDDHLSSGTLTLNGGTLTNSTASYTIDNAIVLGANGGTFNIGGGSGAAQVTLSGVVSGTGSLTKNGQAILELSGNNTYTGAINVTAGTVIASHSNALGTTAGTTTVSSGATVRLAGALTVAESFSLSGTGKAVSAVNYGALHLISGSTTVSGSVTLAGDADISAASGSALTISGALSGGASKMNKTDAGTVILSNSGNEAGLTGGTTVTAGTLSVAADDNLASGTVTLNGGSLAITGSTTIDNAIAVAAASTISNSSNATLSGVLSGTGTLTKSGASTLTLSGSNTHSGAVNLTAGGLTLSGGSALGNDSAVTLSGGTTLTVSTGETIGSLAGSGSVVLNAGLTSGGDNTSTTYSGVISGSSGLTKVGSGTLTLTGNNVFSGPVTVSSGGLTLNRVGGALSDSSSVTVASGATLTISAAETIDALFGAGTVALGAQTLTVGVNGSNSNFSGVITGSGTLTQDGTGTLTLSGTNGAQGWNTQIFDGTLSIGSASNLGTGSVSLSSGTLSIDTTTTLINAITLSGAGGTIAVASGQLVGLSGTLGGTAGLSKAGSGTLTLSGSNNYSGSTTVSAGTLSVTGSTASATTVASGATLAGNGTLGGNMTVQSGGTLSPGNSIGTLTVNGNLQMNAGSILAVEINGATAGTGYDQVLVNGTVDVTGATLAVTHGYTPGQGDSYVIISNNLADAVTGTFSGLAEGGTTTAGGNGTVLTASYAGGDGNDFTLTAPINAAPVIGNLNGDSVGVIEGGSPVLLDSGSNATVTDLDSGNFDGGNVTVAIVSNRASGEDILAVQNQGTGPGQIGVAGSSITYGGVLIGSFSGGTGTNDLVISLNGNATPAAVQALVRSLTYANSNTADPSTATRTVRVTVDDGDGGTSSNADIAASVTGVNDAPTLSATGGTPTYTENAAAVDLFNGVSIGTIEAGQTITGLILTVGNLANGASEILRIDGTDISLVNGANGTTTGGNGIGYSVSVSGGTATITLTIAGGLSTANAQTVIDGMGYRNSSESPTVGNRVVTLTSVRDNGGTANGGMDTTSISHAATVGVVAVNDAPVLTAPATIAVVEDVTSVLTGISISDVDAGLGSVTVSFSVPSGTLAATSGSGVTVGGSGTGTLTLSGTVADINAFIAASGLSFVTASNAATNVVLTVAVDDGGNTGTDPGLSGTGSSEADVTTVTLVVSAVNDAPVNSLPASATVDQDAVLVFSGGNGNLISLSDVDAGGGTVRVTLTASNGLLTLSGTSGLSFLVGSGAGDGTVTFEGSITDINNALNGLSFTPTPGYNGAASLQIVSNDLGLTGSGGDRTDTDGIAITVSPINPLVTNVSASTPDGGYKVGDVITVTITFDQSVIVDTTGGTPTLLLETGPTDRNASYVSGSGSNTLTFSYTVQAGDLSADLDYQSTGALALNGATIRNAGNDDAVLSLPGVGGANSIAGQSAIVIDGVAPTVTSVAVPANGTYVAGQNLDFTVNLSEAVTVDTSGGSPRIAVTLDTGGTVFANYLSGSGSTALVFRLTVASGQLDSNGISVGGAILVNGATLSDGLGNDADPGLNNVASTTGVQVDAVAPGVASVSVPTWLQYREGSLLTFVVNASEAVFVNGAPLLALDIGGSAVFADYLSGSGSSALVFQYRVQPGENDADGITVTGLASNGATLRDASGNDMTLTLNNVGDTRGVVIDTRAPSASGIVRVDASPTNAGSVRYTLTFDEDVSGVDLADFSLVTTGTASGNLAALVQVDARTYTLTVDGLSGTGTLGLDLNTSGTGIIDGAQNPLSGGLVGALYSLDRNAPLVTRVDVPANGTYVAGQHLDFTVNLSEAVTVDTSGGSPRLAITLEGGGTVFADYIGGSGTIALVFRLTVASGQFDSNGISIGSAILANGATLRDAVGNDADVGLNDVASTAGVRVDAVAPAVASVSVPVGLSYNAGDVLTFVVNASEAVWVNGTPRLALDMGGSTVFADYVAGSGSGTLVFQYSVQPGDNDADGVAVSGLVSNGGTLRDAAGNDLNLTLDAVGDTHGVIVDTTAPSAIGLVRADASPTSARTLRFTLTFSEEVSGLDLEYLSLDTAGNAVGTLQSLEQVDARTYQVMVGNVAGNGSLGISLNSPGTGIRDAAGNALVGSLVGEAYVLNQSEGDPQFRIESPVRSPETPNAPIDVLLPEPPPPPFSSPLLPLPLFEVQTLGSGFPTLGSLFRHNGAVAPSFIAQVFAGGGVSDGDASANGFLGFGGGDAGVFGISSLAGFFNRGFADGAGETTLFDRKLWHRSADADPGAQGGVGAPTLGQQLQDIQDNEQRQIDELARALRQIKADPPQA